MRKFAALLMLLSLGMFNAGCDNTATDDTTAPATDPATGVEDPATDTGMEDPVETE